MASWVLLGCSWGALGVVSGCSLGAAFGAIGTHLGSFFASPGCSSGALWALWVASWEPPCFFPGLSECFAGCAKLAQRNQKEQKPNKNRGALKAAGPSSLLDKLPIYKIKGGRGQEAFSQRVHGAVSRRFKKWVKTGGGHFLSSI